MGYSVNVYVDLIFLTQSISVELTRNSNTKEIKNALSALLSYISTREFLSTREKCGETRAEGECFSHFSSVLKNSQVLI